jgi:hypothetical protein
MIPKEVTVRNTPVRSLVQGDIINFGALYHREPGVVIQITKMGTTVTLLLLTFGKNVAVRRTAFYAHEYVCKLCVL